jgi:hypothetical protein
MAILAPFHCDIVSVVVMMMMSLRKGHASNGLTDNIESIITELEVNWNGEIGNSAVRNVAGLNYFTPWSRVLERPPVAPLINNIGKFCETRSFITIHHTHKSLSLVLILS